MKKRRKLRIVPTFTLALFTLILLIVALLIIIRSNKKIVYPLLYKDIVETVSVEEGVPEHVIYAVIYTESSFKKDAVSSMGAVGLMQLLPETAEWLLEREGREYDDALLTDPEFSIRYGTRYLKILYDRYGKWDATHAAYHAGFTRVDSWLEEGTAYYNADGQLVGIPIDSTKAYVNKLRVVREQYFNQLEEEREKESEEN